ncbi:hypothetical protein KVR01_002552 [Diaporthe batatas]|uniref:uncharacterized protein n=1 Tax=Diaporthe batatas TaxID=748121 RepID=UPI001D05AB08|nr:uncharacterized protein KVR01_002552 [Diaporthe batatas]KAG8166863.1 hypothetical protein KVR01_002552 [Diaporthe batatas]
MTSSIRTSEAGKDDEKLTTLRCCVVAGGFSSAHSCKHCDKLIIIPGEFSRFSNEVASLEEIRQRATDGCTLWALVSDEVDSQEREFESPGRVTPYADGVNLDVYYATGGQEKGQVTIKVSFFKDGDAYVPSDIKLGFAVLGLPGNKQISNDPHDFALPVNVNPGSAQSFELMRKWTQKCELEHDCGLKDHVPSSMPTMLLKLENVDECGLVRLVELKIGEKQKYLALSYCWGATKQRKLLRTDNRVEFMEDGVRLEQLDATIRDAIRVTRELGYLYLWIDALCIVQDDAESRNSEISRMGDIYENASITIVAARSSSVGEGFLTPRQAAGASTPDKVFKVAYTTSGEEESAVDKWVVLVPEGPEQMGNWELTQEPWDFRAWTLQEDLLSRRQLRFGTKQTSWSCYGAPMPYDDFDGWVRAGFYHPRNQVYENTHQLARIRMILQNPGRVGLGNKRSQERNRWYDMVETYSQRLLSFQKDRLPGISAISRRMGQVFGDEYWCGIWKSEAAWELLWRAQRRAVDATGAQEARNHGTGGPSWTWASYEGGVRFVLRVDSLHEGGLFDRTQLRVDPNFEVVEHVAEYASPEHTFEARYQKEADPPASGRLPQLWTVIRRRGYNRTRGSCPAEGRESEYSRLGTFDLSKPDSWVFNGEIPTEHEYMERFMDIWGGQKSIEEIVLI